MFSQRNAKMSEDVSVYFSEKLSEQKAESSITFNFIFDLFYPRNNVMPSKHKNEVMRVKHFWNILTNWYESLAAGWYTAWSISIQAKKEASSLSQLDFSLNKRKATSGTWGFSPPAFAENFD